jgi:hypothetical protein
VILRRAQLAVAALACVLAGGCGGEAPGGPVEGPGYAAELPEGWEDAGDGGIALAGVESATGSEIESVWLWKDREDGFRPNVNVAIDRVAAGTSAEEVGRGALDVLLDPAAIDSAGLEDAVDVELIEDVAPATLGGSPAVGYEFLNDAGAAELRQRGVIAVRGRRAYAVTFTATTGAFEAREPDFESVLASWRWAPGEGT